MSKRERKELRARLRAEKKKKRAEKQRMKELETPEQKIARRLAKKANKEISKVKKTKTESEKFAGYTNNDNPFGDTNLGEKFVWHKKRDAAIEEGMSLAEQERRAKQLARENAIELEKVKQARAEREKAMEEKDEEKRREQQAKEDEMFQKWIDNEEGFHLEQVKIRSQIRVKDGRAKPIDVLASYYHAAANDSAATEVDMEMHEPYTIFAGLNLEDIEDLYEDIKVYIQIEKDREPEFWEDMQLICEYELEKSRRDDALRNKYLSAPQRRALEIGINPKILKQIHEILRGKTLVQLGELKVKVEKELNAGSDVSYWERMLVELDVQLAKARLRARHQHFLEARLSTLRQRSVEQKVAAALEAPSDDDAKSDAESDDEIVFDEDDLLAIEEEDDEDEDEGGADADIEPPLLPFDEDLEDGETENQEPFVIPEEDAALLLAQRRRVLFGTHSGKQPAYPDSTNGKRKHKALADARKAPGGGATSMTVADAAGDAFVASQRGSMNSDEVEFAASDMVDVKTSDLHLWRDRYRPRKPRFFNRVHTGFEWNKYNQTHYDSDNPPPKIVQGKGVCVNGVSALNFGQSRLRSTS